MYVLMFLAALKLRTKVILPLHVFKIPGGKLGTGATCLLGLIGCAIAFIVGFIPPENIDVGGKIHYFTIFSSGIAVMILPVFLFYWYKAATPQAVPSGE